MVQHPHRDPLAEVLVRRTLFNDPWDLMGFLPKKCAPSLTHSLTHSVNRMPLSICSEPTFPGICDLRQIAPRWRIKFRMAWCIIAEMTKRCSLTHVYIYMSKCEWMCIYSIIRGTCLPKMISHIYSFAWNAMHLTCDFHICNIDLEIGNWVEFDGRRKLF